MANRRTLERFQLLGALSGIVAVVWQRLLFDRLLDVPPPLVALVFWCFFLPFLASHLLLGTAPERASALSIAISVALHLSAVGLPAFGPGPELDEYRWRLAGELSSTSAGLPLSALLSATSILGWAWLSARSMRRRPLALGAATIVLLFGGTTVLGYATGSPWPFGV